MMNLLVFKEIIKNLYQRFEGYIKPIAKFVLAFVVLFIINTELGYDERFNKLAIVLLLSLISAFTPISVLVLIGALVSVAHVYYVSKVLSIITIMILFILYFLFIRFTPKLGIVVLATPILFILKIPYVIPILLGLMYTPIGIIPMACGVIIYYFFSIIKGVALASSGGSLEDTLQMYTYIINNLSSNKQLILSIMIFSLVIIVTYLVRKMTIDYVFDIAIIVGATTNVLGFLIGDLKLDLSEKIISMILGTIVSALIVYIIQFFRLTLDYTATENVQFEDDDYFYYVKAVPKINVTTPEKNVKRINPQSSPATLNMNEEPKNEYSNKKRYEDGEDYDFEEFEMKYNIDNK